MMRAPYQQTDRHQAAKAGEHLLFLGNRTELDAKQRIEDPHFALIEKTKAGSFTRKM
jgi:hypothetical protein